MKNDKNLKKKIVLAVMLATINKELFDALCHLQISFSALDRFSLKKINKRNLLLTRI